MIRPLCALALLLLAAPASTEGFEEWLPPTTLLHFQIPDAVQLRRRLAAGPLPAIFALPEARRSLAGLQGFLTGRGNDPAALRALLDLPTGGVSIALWAEGQPFEIEGALLADLRGNEADFEKAWAALLRAEEERRTVRTSEVRAGDVTIHVREVSVAGAPIGSAWFFHGGVFGFAPQARSLRRLIELRRTRGASLPGNADYARFVAGAQPGTDMRLWVSGRLWGPAGAPDLQPALRAAGLDSLRGVGMELAFVRSGVHSRVLLDIRGKRRGLLAIFREPLPDLGPPAWLPPRLGGAATFHLDHARMLTEALGVADALRPGLAEQLANRAARLKQDKGIDIAGDLVAALGPRTTIALLPLDAWLRRLAVRRGVEPELFGLVLVQQVKNPERMRRVITSLLDMVGPLPFKTVDGVRIHIAPGIDGGAVALFDGYVVLARHPAFVEEMLARRDLRRLRLADDPMWQRAQRFAPKRRMIFSYTSPEPPLFAAAAQDDPRTQRLLRGAGRSQPAWWRRYHDLTVFSMTNADEGLRLTWFTGFRLPKNTPLPGDGIRPR